jgi:hypothetical protein
MEINQKHGSSRTRYLFHDDRVEYSWKDSGGSRAFSVPYTGISRDRESLTERNAWLRNAGILWIILGGVLLAIGLSSGDGPRGLLWLVLGTGCVAMWWFHVARYVVLPSEKGNLLVIDDKEGQRILEQIESRRAAQFREEYDFFPEGDSPEQLRNRFKWLHREGALSDEELQRRLEQTQPPSANPDAERLPPADRALH